MIEFWHMCGGWVIAVDRVVVSEPYLFRWRVWLMSVFTCTGHRRWTGWQP